MTYHLNILEGLLRIPSVSTQPEHLPDMALARDFLIDLFNSLGFSTRILPGQTHPAIYAQLVSDPELPTVLIYGHYDVQPAGAPSQWTTPAFEPNIRKGQIYARGATDNKGQFLIHVMAVKNLIDSGQDLPVNFKFIIEGEEEIGSTSVEEFLDLYPDLFQADYVVLSDTEMLSQYHPSIDVSLRGAVDFEISLQTGSHDLHSGQFGGIAPNPAFILTHLLSRMKNGRGKITIPGFYEDIVPLTPQESADFRRLEPKSQDLVKDGHFYYLGGGDTDLSLNRRRWSEPTLDITGLDSGYTGHGTKNIIPYKATAKLSVRLVPHQDPAKIYHLLVSFFQTYAPKHAVWAITRTSAALPYKAPTDHPVFAVVRQVLKETFGHSPVYTGQGGSIGFVPILAAKLQVPVLLIGFGLPDENLHAPNEHFSLENYELGIRAMTDFYPRISETISPEVTFSQI